MSNEAVLSKLAEGIEDASFLRLYRFVTGWGAILPIYSVYILLLILPRDLVDFPGPKHIMKWMPKFLYEANNFKEKFPLSDVHFYFSAMLVIYVIILVLSIGAAMKCYHTGLKFPFTVIQSRPWKPYRYFVMPALFAVLVGTLIPLPVGLENTGFRGNPFENPVYLPAYCIVFFGLLIVVFPAGALWLGRERARLTLERKKPRKPIFSISLNNGDRADN